MRYRGYRLWLPGLIFFLLAAFGLAQASRPNPGVWKGEGISFLVTEGDPAITTLRVTFKINRRTTVVISLAKRIEVKDGRFEVTTDGFELQGEFVSAGEAMGKASYRKGTDSARMKWTAQHLPENQATVNTETPSSPAMALATTSFLSGHDESVWSMAFTPDHQKMVTGSADHTVRIWDLETGAFLPTLDGHGKGVRAVAFSLDGERVISAGEDGTIKVWDGDTGALLQTLNGHAGEVWAIALTPDGSRLISGASDGVVKYWDLVTYREIRTVITDSPLIRSLVIPSDGKRLITAGGDGLIKIWNLEEGTLSLGIKAHPLPIQKLVLTPDEKAVISCSEDKTIRLWDLSTGNLVKTLVGGHTEGIIALAVAPDGKRLISSALDGTLRIWDLENGTLLQTFACGAGGAYDLRFTHDGTEVAGGMDDARYASGRGRGCNRANSHNARKKVLRAGGRAFCLPNGRTGPFQRAEKEYSGLG